MYSAGILLLVLCAYYAHASDCNDLSGTWQNELGSTMTIKHDVSSNYITGRYKTMVSTSVGAGKGFSNVTGWSVPVKDGAVISFSVLFDNGATVTVWVGQCSVCDEREYIFASYALRKYIDDPKNRWMSTIVNQNTFWKENYSSSESSTAELIDSESREESSDSFVPERDNSKILGDWVSEDGSKMKFTSKNHHEISIQGIYEELLFTGRSGNSKDFTAIGMVFASAKHSFVKAWTGHIHEKEVNDKALLLTSWIEHTFNPSCKTPRNLVRFGMQNFTKIYDGNDTPVADTFLEKIRNFFRHLF
ncbi:uncharacterized protein LOC129220411 [Uloborus diversus]|uniref:uncharacterized protein LOC129220411 n=1 Tax=Uloborus diversus TaxID=327109 RepID=UPI0024092C46|nr:uncharacterized protein LOC129220411 [Uloborus diversus]